MVLDIQRTHTTDITTYRRMVNALSREMGKEEGKTLCMMKAVHENSVEKEKRLRTVLNFELFCTLKKPFICPEPLT